MQQKPESKTETYKGPERRGSVPPSASGRTSSQPPRRSYPPLADGHANGFFASDAGIMKALGEGNFAAIADMGSPARPVLFKILKNKKEEWALRVAAAESALELCGENMRMYDRILSLLALGRTAEAAEIGDNAVLDLLGILKSRDEQPILRNLCIDALVSIALRPENSHTHLSIVAAFTAMISNEREPPVLRANLAFEAVGLISVCDKAKIMLITSALEKASGSPDITVRNSAEHAIMIMGEAPIEDDNPTLRLAEKT